MSKIYSGLEIEAVGSGRDIISTATLTGNYYQDLSNQILECVTRPTILTKNIDGATAYSNNYIVDLRKVGDVSDTLDLVTGKVTKRIGEVVLNGSESWGWNSISNENFTTLSNVVAPAKNKGISLNSCFFTQSSTGAREALSIAYLNYIYLSIDNARLIGFDTALTNNQKISLVKSWLQANPVKVYYELATPEEYYINVNPLYSLNNYTHYSQTQSVKGNIDIVVPDFQKYKPIETQTNVAYIFDKQSLAIKQIASLHAYKINNDDETNGKSEFIIIKKQVNLKKGDILLTKNQYFVIEEIKDNRNAQVVTLVCRDIVHIFDRKLIERDIDTMTSISLEHFIKTTIDREFAQASDPILAIPYLQTTIATNTQVKEPTNSENMIYNFKTFLVNCRQNRNIYTNFEIVQGAQNKLVITISNVEIPQVLIDTTLNDVTDYNKIYEVDPVVKVSCYCQDTQNTKTMYLRADFTTTYDINDNLRITGLTESISVEEEANAEDEMLNVFKSNRYQHYVEFKIRKKSNLVDTSKIQVGTPVKIKTFGIDTEFDVYDSYISAVAFSDAEFISYKSGRLRVTLTDKLAQKML